MKRILCFGDSNTWGYIPDSNAERYPPTVRYTRLLMENLGNQYEVIEEGLPGRTLMSDCFRELIGNRNGALAFGQIAYTHLPLDYILIMLGTNDLKTIHRKTVKECAKALENDYIRIINLKLNGKIKNNPKIIIVAPAIIGPDGANFDEIGAKESLLFNKEYFEVAKRNGCLFVDNEGLEVGSDSVHLTERSHRLLASKIFRVIKDFESNNLK